jgi:single-strand DNA-binding protein
MPSDLRRSAVNVVVVQGHLSRPPEERVLPSGDRVVSLEVTTSGPDGRAESVPVAWPDAPAWVLGLGRGTEVVVRGRVRRRFFRAGTATQSRTEVVADRVVRAARARQVAAVVAEAERRLSAG